MNFEGYSNNEMELKPNNLKENEIKIDLSDSNNEEVNNFNENADNDFGEIITETENNLNNLRNDLNLPNINGITFRNQDNIGKDGEIKNLKLAKSFEDIVHRGQNFSITDGKNETNIVWGKNEKGEYSYIIEGTNIEPIPKEGLKINIYKDFSERKNDKEEKGFRKGITSAPAYRKGKITLCSRTARENLAKLGVKNIKQGPTARASFNMYGKYPESFPPKNNSAKVFDLFCDASPKNRKYGHRAVGIKKGPEGEWYVLDPYYNKTRTPVLASTYIAKMQGKGRKIWGGFSVA